MERLRRALRGVDRPGAPALPIGEALHPVVLLAVVVLLVNDWVLKPRLGGPITGKLSDFAGLVFAPCVLSALIGLVLRLARRDGRVTRRRAIACTAATGCCFAATKISHTGAAILIAVLARLGWPGSEIYVDHTDLIALPALAVAAWVFRDELRRVRSAREQAALAHRDP